MLSFAWKDFMLNTLTAVRSVIGIDIGKIGNVALSTGFQTIIRLSLIHISEPTRPY